MKIRMFTRKLWLFAIILGSVAVNSQAQWSGAYGNEWLEGKYDQEWVKIEVSEKGVQKVTLTGNFLNKANQLHLYHRGEEVALISASESEIEFYGVPNDGESDALLYRPYTGVRANPYYSWFSDKSAYFLTYSSTSPTKLAVNQAIIAPTGTPEPYHIAEELIVYSNDYTHDEITNPVSFSLDQSYYEESKGMTSSPYLKFILSSGSTYGNPIYNLNFKLKNLEIDTEYKPRIEVLVFSRTHARHSVRTTVGKNISTLREVAPDQVFTSFAPVKSSYELNVSLNPNDSDVDTEGNGIFRIEELTSTNNQNTTGVFGVSYIKRIFPQTLDMEGLSSMYLNFDATTDPTSRIHLLNPSVGARVYDISNAHEPKLIPTILSGTNLEFMVERTSGRELKLLVFTATNNNTELVPVNFTNFLPSDYDFLIVTNDNLWSEVQSYANYRNSAAGGGYNSLAVKIKDIYNQFNYGEPSPVAIRRFVDYMIKDGISDKHNLLLVGPSTTIPRLMKLNRELPGEVPTIGFPGSDILLVEGLTANTSDMPTIPVGRISATLPSQVSSYLAKVQEYESDVSDLDWRKKVLHISGGLYTGENTRFSGYLSNYNSYVTGQSFGGSVLERKKADGDYGYPSNSFDFAPDYNGGIGFSAYYGHGSATQTDNNLGYASDPSRGYNNEGKYPVMYFNGCGVGNIFSGRLSPFPGSSSSTLLPLSTDWVVADKKGAIAIISNSYYAFETSSKNFIGALHQEMFKSDASRMTLGKIHQEAERSVLNGYSGARIAINSYDLANNHQSLLQGDPAIKILNVTNPLPVSLIRWNAEILGTSIQLTWETEWEKSNSHYLVERSTDAIHFDLIGTVDGKGDTNSNSRYSFVDNSPSNGVNYYRLVQVDFGEKDSKTYSRIIQVEIDLFKSVVIMPNPTTDWVKLQMDSKESVELIRVYDINGGLIKSSERNDQISLRGLSSGLFIIEVTTKSGKTISKKVLKE